MIAVIFLCIMKSHLFAMFVWNFTTTSLSIAEILLFIKILSKIAVSNIANSLTCQYWRQRLRNFCINNNKMVISREDRMLIKALHQEKGYGSIQLTTRSGSGCRSVSTAQECMTSTTWIDGATDRAVVRLGSQHHLCGSESVVYSSASLRERWWGRALWVWASVVTATAAVTDI